MGTSAEAAARAYVATIAGCLPELWLNFEEHSRLEQLADSGQMCPLPAGASSGSHSAVRSTARQAAPSFYGAFCTTGFSCAVSYFVFVFRAYSFLQGKSSVLLARPMRKCCFIQQKVGRMSRILDPRRLDRESQGAARTECEPFLLGTSPDGPWPAERAK